MFLTKVSDCNLQKHFWLGLGKIIKRMLKLRFLFIMCIYYEGFKVDFVAVGI